MITSHDSLILVNEHLPRHKKPDVPGRVLLHNKSQLMPARLQDDGGGGGGGGVAVGGVHVVVVVCQQAALDGYNVVGGARAGSLK